MAEIFNVSQLKTRLVKDRKIIFTHGTYDLFHIGHLYLLKHSAELGGKLIVGIDSEEHSIQMKRRPIYRQKLRMQLVSQLSFVDYVVLLDMPQGYDDIKYFMSVYNALQPHTITHGLNFPFKEKLRQECCSLNIQYLQIKHKYSYLNTSYYISKIIDELAT